MDVFMTQNNDSIKDEITRRAYGLYLMRGCEHGRDVEDWVRAERELSDESFLGDQCLRAPLVTPSCGMLGPSESDRPRS